MTQRKSSRAKTKTSRAKKTKGSWLARVTRSPRTRMSLFICAFALVGASAVLFSYAQSDAATGPIVGVGQKCLSSRDATPQKGSYVELRTCKDGDKSQQWTVETDGTIRNQSYCLDVQWAGKHWRTPVWLWSCNKTVAQQWKMTDQGLINPNANLCLDDQWSHTADGNPIWMWGCNHTDAQKWTLPQKAEPTPQPTPTPTPTPTPAPAPSPAQPNGVGGSWKSIFDDEFSGTSVDTKKWWPNWYNKTSTTPPDSTDDRTCYNPNHVVVHDGEADLNATTGGCTGDKGQKYKYTSGILQSYGRFEFTYGFMEARIKAPIGHGLWPAWWAINDNGEIDVLEIFGDGHTGAAANYHGGVEYSTGRNIPTAATEWHTYAADWEKGKVTFYYDGKDIGHVSSSKVTSHKLPLILNLEIGPKDAAATNAKVPATMKVDYVRVWQKQ